jgi:alpha-tubulin suppressor-like RCC1 family protein
MLLIQETGDIICWGGNEKGQLGLGHYQDINTP